MSMRSVDRPLDVPPENYDKAVYLNIPYNDTFRNPCFAYVAASTGFGLEPVIASQYERLPDAQAARCLHGITRCRYSAHHLTRERHNIQFELGLAYANCKFGPRTHGLIVIADEKDSIAQVLSDWKGMGLKIYDSGFEASNGICATTGIYQAFSNSLLADKRKLLTFNQFAAAYEQVESVIFEHVAQDLANTNIFAGDVFREVVKRCKEHWQNQRSTSL